MKPEDVTWAKALWPWKDLRGIRMETIILNHGPIDSRANDRSAAHPFYTWWWLEKGAVTLTVQGHHRVVPARHWVLIPVGLARYQHFSADAQLSSINFLARWPNGLPLFRLADLVVQKATPQSPLIEAALAAHRAGGTPFTSKFVSLDQRKLSLSGYMRLATALGRFIECLLSQSALQEAARCAPSTGDARLDLVVDHLSRFLRAGPLPYAEWKRATGLSRPHLDRLARASLGVSLREHRDHLLLTEIHRRLSIDRSSIKLHALELGFVDSSHFCHWVKRQSGLTPQMLASSRA